MIELDLLAYQSQLDLRQRAGKRYIFDPIRQKELVLTPEELVRQLLIQYLQHERRYPAARMAVEKLVRVNGLRKRCDLLIFDQATLPYLLVECKRADVPINAATFKQIAWYNMPLRVPYLLVTNGRHTYCCSMNYTEKNYRFLDAVPVFGTVD